MVSSSANINFFDRFTGSLETFQLVIMIYKDVEMSFTRFLESLIET